MCYDGQCLYVFFIDGLLTYHFRTIFLSSLAYLWKTVPKPNVYTSKINKKAFEYICIQRKFTPICIYVDERLFSLQQSQADQSQYLLCSWQEPSDLAIKEGEDLEFGIVLGEGEKEVEELNSVT